jgi:hypothetical protein
LPRGGDDLGLHDFLRAIKVGAAIGAELALVVNFFIAVWAFHDVFPLSSFIRLRDRNQTTDFVSIVDVINFDPFALKKKTP